MTRMIERRTFVTAAAWSIVGMGSTRGVAGATSNPTLYEDKFGLIVQRDGDGGDTAQREGWAWFGSWIRANVLNNPWSLVRKITFSEVMGHLEIESSGLLRRHPVQWNDPKDFSRDQTIPLVAAMGVYGDSARLERVWMGVVNRGFRAQNGDFIGPDTDNLFARARGKDPGGLGDFQLFGGVWTRIGITQNNPDDVGDDLNLIVLLLMAKIRKSSSWTDRAIHDYAKNRPISYGCYLASYRAQYGTDYSVTAAEMRSRMDAGIKGGWKVDCPRVLGALRWYFRAESGGNPELAELYEPMVRKWLE